MRLSFLSILLLIILSPHLSLAAEDLTIRRQSCENFVSRMGAETKSTEYSESNTEWGEKTTTHRSLFSFLTKWKEWGEKTLNRNLTEIEEKALLNAYHIGRFILTNHQIEHIHTDREDLVKLLNFTSNDLKNLLLKERKWILNQAGFTDEEINLLLLDGKLGTSTDVYISQHFLLREQPIPSPEVSKLFSAVESTRKRVTIDELNLPHKKDLPPLPSSYGPEYTAGWTQIQEGIAFAKAIRDLDPLPNPHKTHIEWFVPQIPQSIENAKQILRQLQGDLNEKPEERITAKEFGYFGNDELPDINQLTEDLQKAFHQLESLEVQASQAVHEERVTYSWWLEFNQKLLEVTPKHKSPYNRVERLMPEFPIVIALPIKQMDHKELGIMSINKAYQNRVTPIELVSTLMNSIDGDGRKNFFSPHHFYTHDVSHAKSFSEKIIHTLNYSFFPLREAEKIHIQFMNSLQGKERIQMENIYFLIRHEDR